MTDFYEGPSTGKDKHWPTWLTFILLIVILAAGATFRLTGTDWDEGQHLHPDERFLTMVVTSIQPVKLGDYFNTTISTLNPYNVGQTFYVYGTLPLLFTKYLGEAFGMNGYGDIYLLGRYLSALMDLLTCILVFLAATRLFKNEKIGLLAAGFSACSVLPIQLSHYFTVDTFSNFFAFLAIYLAIVVMTVPFRDRQPEGENTKKGIWEIMGGSWQSLTPYAGFGVALGLAVACKVNAGLIAFLLPIAAWVWWSRLEEEDKEQQFWVIFRNLVIAALISLVVFRIFQPYAFMGPGFFGLKINPNWIANLKEIANISSGDVEVPYAWQWARRPITFALQNMVIWGLGLPLGLLAWTGFAWMAWRIFKGEWRNYLLIWVWTALYFAWQSISWVRAMRYQLLVYPTLAIIASWFIFDLWNRKPNRLKWLPRVSAVTLGSTGLILTAIWAIAFIQIYTRPMTRIAASQWIYENIPGPLNLQVQTAEGLKNQPLGYHQRLGLNQENPVDLTVKAEIDGSVTGFQIGHIVDGSNDPVLMGGVKTIVLEVFKGNTSEPVAAGFQTGLFPADPGDIRGPGYTIQLDHPVVVQAGELLTFRISLVESGMTLYLSGTVALEIYQSEALRIQPLMDAVELIGNGAFYQEAFSANFTGDLQGVLFNRAVDWTSTPGMKTLKVTILDPAQGGAVLGSGIVSNSFLAADDPRGEEILMTFSSPVSIVQSQIYYVQIELVEGSGQIGISGNRPALESPWDDPLPLGLNGYNPFDYYSGIYRTDLNFEIYWDDSPDKVKRLVTMMDQADYIFMTSGRQWGTLPRVPERFPMTSTFYRELLGCPEEKDVVWCYRVAETGMFNGNLGFELVTTFESNPNLGSLEFNSQFAEEAFTVYDAPKVMIFKKTQAYRHEQVAEVLSNVDLSTILKVTPGGAGKSKGTLMLPSDRLAVQQAGGTWSDLFDWNSVINSHPIVTIFSWYLFISLLGWIVFPYTRLALGGLRDKGFGISRLIGMVIFAWLAWISGSANISISRTFLAFVFIFMVLASSILGWLYRKDIVAEMRSNWKHYVRLEILALAFFLIFLLVRLGNPDLWHPYKGGEKPMDFSYFNAVLKSSTFPPYDPWFAGGYINYYYYGFVLVGMPVKLLGIIPSLAYNLILPTLFSMLAMAAFTIGFNLVYTTQFSTDLRRALSGQLLKFKFFTKQLPSGKLAEVKAGEISGAVQVSEEGFVLRKAWLAGISASAFMVLLGNLGSVRMVWHGIMRLAAPGGVIDPSNLFQRFGWTISGFFKYLSGTPLPYPPGDWYWIPSRVYPGEPITEFPLFTFLYADLHAHMFALILTAGTIAWILSILLKQWKWEKGWKGWVEAICTFLAGAMLIGALRPTNTWDFPTYLILAGLVILYTGIKYYAPSENWLQGWSQSIKKWITVSAILFLFIGLTVLLYQPFAHWFGQAYTALDLYKGEKSAFWSFITHWGVFIFILLSWLIQESLDWMIKTPASRLKVLKPYQGMIQFLAILFLLAVIGLFLMKVLIGWLVLGIAAWALVLMLRPGQSDVKRLVLFMVGTAMTIALAVELVTLRGDLGRMNTVFKFYLQAWTLLSVSSGAALIWLLPEVMKVKKFNFSTIWTIALILLVCGAAWFPILAGKDKITDRISPLAPHTMDGMKYMEYSTYNDQGFEMDLSQDYRAIRWMQENVKGSPVIVEGNTPEYRWGSRYTIYTGLPGVAGWNWHQRQQRAVLAVDWVWPRVDEINAFYNGVDPAAALAFLQKYNVKYIVVGQLEKIYYTPEGILKFKDLNRVYWNEVYQDSDTAVYEVITND